WDEVNARLEKRKEKWAPARKTRYLFSGLVYCHCGTKMYKPSNMKKYYCRKCLNKMPEHDLELIFAEQLRGFFMSPDEIASRLAENDKVIADKRTLLDSIRDDLASVEREM